MVNKVYPTPLIRGIDVLEALASSHKATKHMTFDELVSATKIPRSSMFRILSALESRGLAERNKIAGSDSWRLGYNILTLANAKLSQLDRRIELRPIIERLAEEVDEFVQLGILHNKKVMYIDMVKRSKNLAFVAEIGATLPINVSAAGMVLASCLDDTEIQKLLENQAFPKNTEKTINDPQQIIETLKIISEQGYAYDDQMYAVGIRCIAAPVFNHTGQAIAAINITGTTASINDERLDYLRNKVILYAQEGSKRMGYSKTNC